MIDRLEDEGMLTEAEALALAETFVLPDAGEVDPDRASERRTYFTEALRDYLLNAATMLGDTYQERYNQLFRGGLRIHTTLDPILQAQAEQARDVLPETTAGFDAAIVSLDSTPGRSG